MIRFDNVTKRYPDGTVAVDGLTLEAPTGKITVFVGPSGCGKTTSLRMINRMIEPTSGRICIDGREHRTSCPPQLRRGIGYVIQHAGLFPHRTVIDNVATVPFLLGQDKKQARARALELLERVGLTQPLRQPLPGQLSGGQQQRVGVARALAADPPVMLMDEPFSAVDPVVREQLQDEFLRLQADLGKTIVFVTHDIDEAIKLGDQVAVLRVGGKLAQLASPAELLARPANAFVAGFVGRDRGYRALGFAEGEVLPSHGEPTVTIGEKIPRGDPAYGEWLLVVDDADEPQGWLHPPTRPARPTTSLPGVSVSRWNPCGARRYASRGARRVPVLPLRPGCRHRRQRSPAGHRPARGGRPDHLHPWPGCRGLALMAGAFVPDAADGAADAASSPWAFSATSATTSARTWAGCGHIPGSRSHPSSSGCSWPCRSAGWHVGTRSSTPPDDRDRPALHDPVDRPVRAHTPLLGFKDPLNPLQVPIALTVYSVALLVRVVADGLAAVPEDTLQAATAIGFPRCSGSFGSSCRSRCPSSPRACGWPWSPTSASSRSPGRSASPTWGRCSTSGYQLSTPTAYYPPIVLGIVLCVLLALVLDALVLALNRCAHPVAEAVRS